MLHVAFDELPAGGDQQMLAQQLRSRERERHHILQLIAKAERPARLIEAASVPTAVSSASDTAASRS